MIIFIHQNNNGVIVKIDTLNRRILIRERLIERGKVSSADFAKEFEVSRNTIIKDLSILSMFMPIVVSPGSNGGYEYMGEKYLKLTEKELSSIIPILNRAKDTGVVAKAAVNKINDFLGEKRS